LAAKYKKKGKDKAGTTKDWSYFIAKNYYPVTSAISFED
jgi:hypothetical protein